MKNSIRTIQTLSLVSALVALAVHSANAATDFWNGGVSSGNWNNGANWVSGSAPSTFDLLNFTNQSGAADIASNDFTAGIVFDGITFGSSSSGSTFTLIGNSILLSGASNNIAAGVVNSTSFAETVSNNLTLDWGYYTFSSPAGSLSLNGSLTPNTGGVAFFGGSNVKSASFTTDATGLISGLGGLGLIGTNTLALLPLATMSGGNVVALPIGSYTTYATGAVASNSTANVELSASTAVSYTDANCSVNTITIDKNVGGNGSPTVKLTTTGTLTLGTHGGIYVTGTGAGNKQDFELTGGNLTAGVTNVGGVIVLGINGTTTGNQIQQDSTIINNGTGLVTLVKMGPGSMYMDKANTYSGGTYVDEGYLQLNVGSAASGASAIGAGPVYIASGATVYPNTANTNWANNFFISPGLGANALQAGVGALKMGNGSGFQSLNGTLTLLGSPVTTAPGDRVALSGNGGTINLLGQITGSGTLDLSGQAATTTLDISNVTASANNWSGGIIVNVSAAADNLTVQNRTPGTFTGNLLLVRSGGAGTITYDMWDQNESIAGLNSSGSTGTANIQTGAGATLTVGNNNASGNFGGTIINAVSLVKVGNGTQTLTGANTYSGNTTVLGGTLALAGSGAISSPQILVSNATFDISGDASPYTGTSSIGMMSNATFNVGNVLASSVSSLSISNSTLVFPLNQSSANITVSGTFATGGSANTINITSVPGFGSYPQQFPLIKYGSADSNLVDVNNNLTALSLVLPVQGGLAGYLTNNTGNLSIDLVLTNGPIVPVEPITWRGQTNGVNTGTWDILTTSNWVLTADGVTPYFYQDTSPVTFDDTATGTTNVNLTKTVLPASITFNNTNTIYTLSGTGKISGTTAWINNGTGTVKLTETGGDNFSGGITVNNGTLIIDNNSSGINGGLAINSPGTVQLGNNDANGVLPSGTFTDNGALVLSRSDTALNFASVISGNGALTNNGTGTVTFSAGPNVLSATINSGIVKINGGGGGGGCLSSNIIVNAGGELDLNVNDSLGYNVTLPPLTVSGIVKKLNSQAETLGRVIILSGGTLATTLSGVEQYESQNNYIQTAAGTANYINGPGKFGLRISSCYITNAPSSTLTISCVIETNSSAGGNTAPLNKHGTGTLILSGNNTFTGGANIYDGVVQLGTAGDTGVLTALGLGGAVTINTGGILNFASSQGITVTGAISDDGTGLVLMNSGTNVLAGVNTYTGNTIVNAGATLKLTGSGSINGSTSITVSNATLDVSASSNAVNNTSGSLSMTNSTFNLGTNLVTALNSLAISNTTLIFSVNPVAPNINLTGSSGTLTTGGTTNVINLTAVPGFLYYPTNIPLIKYLALDPGVTNGNNNLANVGLILPALGSPSGYLTNDIVNGSIDLMVLSDTLTPILPITWSGQTNGVNTGSWDILTTPDWVFTSDLTTPYKYQDISAVTFDDTATGTTNVNLTTAVSPGSLVVSNNLLTYTFSGVGKISGNVGLIKLNSGTAIFTETNGDNFNGGVTVGGGTLILSNANANITGGLTVNSGSLIDEHNGTISGGLTLNGGSALLDQSGSISGNLNISSGTVQVGNNDVNGNLPSGTISDGDTLIFDRSNSTLNVGTVISGGGTLENNGTGTVTLSAIETLTGLVVVNAGTLAVNESVNGNPDGISASSGLTINTNATFMFESDNAGFGTAASGAVPVTINAGGTLTGLGSADGGNGTSSHIPNVLYLNGGTLAMQGPPAVLPSHGSWDLYSGVNVNSGPNYLTTSTISALGVIPIQSGGTHFDVTASPGGTPSGIDLLVSGSLIDGTAGGAFVGSGIILNPNGETGVMALDNNNTFLGGVTIDGGTLQLGTPSDTNALTEPMGPGTVTINTGGILKFDSGVGVTVTNVIGDDNSGNTLVLSRRGTNFLTAANTYTGNTLVRASTLALIGSGSINSSASITVSNGTFDVSASSSAVASSGSLSLTNSTFNLGTNFVTSLNRLAISNSTLLFPINTNSLAPNINLAGASGILVAGGTTNVINITSMPVLSAFPTNIHLIAYAALDSGITNGNNVLNNLGVKLPVLGSPVGYLTNNIASSSIDLVVVSQSFGPGTFTNAPGGLTFSLNGGNVVITGTGGQAGDAYYLLASTNVALPLSQWTVVATNVLGANGSFTFTGTNAVTPGDAQQFYILSNTNSNHQ